MFVSNLPTSNIFFMFGNMSTKIESILIERTLIARPAVPMTIRMHWTLAGTRLKTNPRCWAYLNPAFLNTIKIDRHERIHDRHTYVKNHKGALFSFPLEQFQLRSIHSVLTHESFLKTLF